MLLVAEVSHQRLSRADAAGDRDPARPRGWAVGALTCRCRACFSRRLTAFSLRSAFSWCTRETALRSAGSRPTARRCSSVGRFWGPDTLGLLLYGSAACA